MDQSKIAGILLCLMGLLLSMFPQEIWHFTEKWKSDSASEPSAKYLMTLRILSGAFIGIGVLLAGGVIR